MKGWEVQQVGAAVRRPFLGSRGSNCLAAPKQDVGGSQTTSRPFRYAPQCGDRPGGTGLSGL